MILFSSGGVCADKVTGQLKPHPTLPMQALPVDNDGT